MLPYTTDIIWPLLSAIITLTLIINHVPLRVQGQQLVTPCPSALKINTNIQYRGSVHFICLQPPSSYAGLNEQQPLAGGYNLPNLQVINLDTRQLVWTQPVDELGTNQMVSFVDSEGTLRILLSTPNRINGTSMYSVDRDGNFLSETHTINTQFVNSMAVWKLELNLQWQLAIANQPTFDSVIQSNDQQLSKKLIPNLRPMISLHSWRSTYFDSYQLFEVPLDGAKVNKLEPIYINGQEFLVVSLESSKQPYGPNAGGKIPSLIYKLDFGDGSLNWSLFQKIETLTMSLDVKTFTMTHDGSWQKDYYLAFLGQTSLNSIPGRKRSLGGNIPIQSDEQFGLIIYKYIGDQFVLVNLIPLQGVTRLDTIKSGAGESYAVIATQSQFTNKIDLYVFDGITLRRKEANDTDEQLETRYNKRDFVGSVESTLELFTWCKRTIQDIVSDTFDQQSKLLMSLPKVNQQRPIELNGDLIIENNLQVSNLLYTNHVAELNSTLPQEFINIIHQPMANYSQTFNQIRVAHQEIDSVKRHIDSLLIDDGSQQDVFTTLRFDKVFLECPLAQDLKHNNMFAQHPTMNCPHIQEIRTNWLNSRNITNIQQQASLTGRSMVITSDVRFEHLVLRGSVDILSTLNDLRVDDIIFKTRPSTYRGPIFGHKIFKNNLYIGGNSRLLVDSYNNYKLDRNNYLTASGEQYIDADLRLQQIIIDSYGLQNNLSSRIEKLNGIPLDMHLQQIALSDAQNDFQDPIHFDELILNGPINFKYQSILSGINLDALWLTTMFKHSNQNITALMEFSNSVKISYGGDLIVDGPINSVPFNPSTVLLRTKDYRLPNPIVFEGDVNVNQLYVDKALNGIQAAIKSIDSNIKELGILYDGGSQFITADKMFNDVHLGGQSHVIGNINGHLNLSELHVLANNNGGEPYKFSTIKLTGSNIKISDRAQIHIDSTINGIKANDLCSLAVRISQTPYNLPQQYNKLRFDDLVHFKSLRCASINGFNNLTRSFLTRNGDQQILGTLKLTNGPIFNKTVNIRTSINDMDVQPLSRSVKQQLNDSLTGHRDYYGDLILDDLFTEKINQLPMSNIFLAKSDNPQFIRAEMDFDHLDIENVLVIDQNMYVNTFNNLNISDLIENTLQYDKPQVIFNHVEVNTLQLLPNSNFITKNLNGFDLQKLYSDSVLIDVPQQILAPKIFRSPIEFTNRVYLRHGIDGLTDEELRFNLLLHSDEMIDGDLIFNNDVIIKKELEILSGLINDVDVNVFVDSMIYEKNSGQNNGLRIYGNGSVRFNDVILNSLVVAGTISGIDLSKEALLRNENINGTLNDRMKADQQINISNQKFLNNYGPGSNIGVKTQYRGNNHTGYCYVHSCSKTTLGPQLIPSNNLYRPTPVPFFRPPQPPQMITTNQGPPNYMQQQPPPFNQTHIHQQPIQQFIKQFYPVIIPRPVNQVNISDMRYTWQPHWQQVLIDRRPPPPLPRPLIIQTNNQTHHVLVQQPAPQPQPMPIPTLPPPTQMTQLIDPKYLEYKAMIQALAIKNLALKLNRFLSTSFYYEIVQKQPLLGPILNAVSNPIYNEEGHSFLLFKTNSKPGESCLQEHQSVAIMAQKKHFNPIFGQTTRISETSNPISVESLTISNQVHYLMILDLYKDDSNSGLYKSRILIYLWDYNLGLYDLKWTLPIEGYASTMKVFNSNDLACIALAKPNHRVNNKTRNAGSPVIYCQREPLGLFDKMFILGDLTNVFDLDVATVAPKSTQIVLGMLSQQDSEQIGDMNVCAFDIASGRLDVITSRRLARPLKLHFFKSGFRPWPIQLVISEAITSNNNNEALTRIYSIIDINNQQQKQPLSLDYFRLSPNTSQLIETQIIKDSEYFDIQSVKLDQYNSMLFMQSANFISIYAPLASHELQVAGNYNISRNYYDTRCQQQSNFGLVHRLPTKGANKFLVFNDHRFSKRNHSIVSSSTQPFKHFLVLSKDDCEHEKRSTLILRPKFSK